MGINQLISASNKIFNMILKVTAGKKMVRSSRCSSLPRWCLGVPLFAALSKVSTWEQNIPVSKAGRDWFTLGGQRSGATTTAALKKVQLEMITMMTLKESIDFNRHK